VVNLFLAIALLPQLRSAEYLQASAPRLDPVDFSKPDLSQALVRSCRIMRCCQLPAVSLGCCEKLVEVALSLSGTTRAASSNKMK
jgi:hypothetical protein